MLREMKKNTRYNALAPLNVSQLAQTRELNSAKDREAKELEDVLALPSGFEANNSLT